MHLLPFFKQSTYNFTRNHPSASKYGFTIECLIVVIALIVKFIITICNIQLSLYGLAVSVYKLLDLAYAVELKFSSIATSKAGKM